MYYFSELPNPKPTRFVDPLNTQWSTLPGYDERWFGDLHEIINIGPIRERDKMKINSDGSVDLYIGPKAPKGYENNWIPTGGKTPFLLFRFYGPTEALFDKTFVLNDVELVE